LQRVGASRNMLRHATQTNLLISKVSLFEQKLLLSYDSLRTI